MNSKVRRIVLVLALSFALMHSTTRADPAVPLEYQVKAAFLINFVKFLEWPDSQTKSGIRLCILGNDPFGSKLEDLAAAKGGDIKVDVLRFAKGREAVAAQCHLLFRSFAALAQGADTFTQSPTITVGEDDSTALINLVIVDGKVRFHVDQSGIENRGIKVSSKLMKLVPPKAQP